mmetsp:Transcript_9015/g.11267  ORF Transcript_9015/g.11267 Transcript_9015/m.11267 type:complete len:356 (-) Transcript_9015:549-1616(-)
MRSLAKSVILRTTLLQPGPFPTPDPFLFVVYHNDHFPVAHDDSMEAPRRGNGADFDPRAEYRMYHGEKIPGFPQHPHRGFETITATMDGIIDHSDSLGNGGRYGEGDVQWMTAGKGVVHGEMFPLIQKDKPNNCRFFQIWLNLPSRHKMVDPDFKMFWNTNVPKYTSEDGLGNVTVFYGDYFLEQKDDTCERIENPNQPPPYSWATDPINDVAVLHITIQPGGNLTIPAAHNGDASRALYLIEGYDGIVVGNKTFRRSTMLTVDASQPITISVPANSESVPGQVLMLQGKPIGEPVAQHGPFVMNTQSEIRQAFADYQQTQFGGWPWQRNDMVFPRDKGRFALLDGKETTPPAEK